MFQDHLILPPPPVLPVCLALFSQRLFRRQGSSPTLQGELEGLQGCAFMCLNFLWSLLLNQQENEKIKDDVKNNNGIPVLTLKKSIAIFIQ